MRFDSIARHRTWGADPTPPGLQGLRPDAATGPGLTPALDAARLDALSQAVLLLHRGSRDWPAASFDTRAIDTLAGVLPHTACLWGNAPADTAPATPPSVQGLFSQGLDAATLADCLAGHGPQPGLQASLVEPLAGRRVTLQLWRADAARPFDDADRQALAFVLPHLVETQRENRLDQARHGDPMQRSRRSLLLCDLQGQLQQVDEQGLALLRQEWPRWLGRSLPAPLNAALQTSLVAHAGGPGQAARAAAPAPTPAFYGKVVTVLMAPSGAQVLLEIRRRSAADRLSSRQRDIALRYAAGQSGPQIAEQLGLSSSTVNNHLGMVFKRLGVSSKLQLSQTLRLGGELPGAASLSAAKAQAGGA
jgi:DNA-binding CsgD family transcriptional regulator